MGRYKKFQQQFSSGDPGADTERIASIVEAMKGCLNQKQKVPSNSHQAHPRTRTPRSQRTKNWVSCVLKEK